MSKNKKPRPVWLCPRCGMRWVNCDPVCILCEVYGEPQNESAEKILRKAGEREEVKQCPKPENTSNVTTENELCF